ncbi:MAG: NAD(P)H-hydrate dehydratase [Candidatus Omnitrophica bacterium]|nr:NAD(P)H-hydrate dehydratase [Candidatus Omnitrophota bacterium]
MRLPAPLLRRNPRAYKNQFGHVLILAGSPRMLGAAALTSLAAMRAGAGLVTLGIPNSLNSVVQKKISLVVMTWPLKESKVQAIDFKAWAQIEKRLEKFSAIAIGPGLGEDKSTQKFIRKVIENSVVPLVIDADALNALAQNLKILLKTKTPKILTPHPGEMQRLVSLRHKIEDQDRRRVALDFAKQYRCVLVLKGHHTVVASDDDRCEVNRTGNVGMATAGSGDVLTGMIAAFLAQGIEPFEAAKLGVALHGRAGDLAAKEKGKVSMIATDIIDGIPQVLKSRK